MAGLESWKDEVRELPRERFDSILTGRGDELPVVLVPLQKGLVLRTELPDQVAVASDSDTGFQYAARHAERCSAHDQPDSSGGARKVARCERSSRADSRFAQLEVEARWPEDRVQPLDDSLELRLGGHLRCPANALADQRRREASSACIGLLGCAKLRITARLHSAPSETPGPPPACPRSQAGADQ